LDEPRVLQPYCNPVLTKGKTLDGKYPSERRICRIFTTMNLHAPPPDIVLVRRRRSVET
jgi:hypothetical protein